MKDFHITGINPAVSCYFMHEEGNEDTLISIEAMDFEMVKITNVFTVCKRCPVAEVEATFERFINFLIAEYPQFSDIDFMECARKGGRFLM